MLDILTDHEEYKYNMTSTIYAKIVKLMFFYFPLEPDFAVIALVYIILLIPRKSIEEI